MKPNELNQKTTDELRTERAAIQKEIFNLRMQRGIGQTPQTHLFKQLRRDIARINTKLREREGS